MIQHSGDTCDMKNFASNSLMLRYEADVMRFQANVMSQRSRFLEMQARLCEQQETPTEHAKKVDMYQHERSYESDSTSEVDITSQQDQKEDRQFYDQFFPSPIQPVVSGAVVKSEVNTEASTLNEDLTNLHDLIIRDELPGLDSEIFKSSLFREAEQLIAGDTGMNQILKQFTVDTGSGQDSDQDTATERKPQNLYQLEEACRGKNLSMKKTTQREWITLNENNLLSTPTFNPLPEFEFSRDELYMVLRLNDNIRKALKCTIRPEFFQSVIDFRLEKINRMQFMKVQLIVN